MTICFYLTVCCVFAIENFVLDEHTLYWLLRAATFEFIILQTQELEYTSSFGVLLVSMLLFVPHFSNMLDQIWTTVCLGLLHSWGLHTNYM